MSVSSDIKLYSLVELAEPVGGFPAGRRGGVVEAYSDGTLLVELTDDPSLDPLDRLVTARPEKLRLVRP
jgi:hypothetical protein